MSNATTDLAPAFPRDSWYVVATSPEVTNEAPLGRRALNTSLVLWRTPDGDVVCLDDRDAHRPYPLSLGTIDGAEIVSGYSGFRYDATGACVHVPTQEAVPYGAGVGSYPVIEQDGGVWVWLGQPGLARLHHPPRSPWLSDDGWSSFGDAWITNAGYHLLHENFADITHVAVVAPFIAPPALAAGPVPVLDVTVSETQVKFERTFEAAPVASWQADLLGVSDADLFTHRESGEFVAPGLWVNRWTVELGEGRTGTFVFTHAVTPIDEVTTQHIWRVSRDFGPGEDVSANIEPLFTEYYLRVKAILETMQQVLTHDGPRREVNVTADAAALQVRRILARMAATEQR